MIMWCLQIVKHKENYRTLATYVFSEYGASFHILKAMYDFENVHVYTHTHIIYIYIRPIR